MPHARPLSRPLPPRSSTAMVLRRPSSRPRSSPVMEPVVLPPCTVRASSDPSCPRCPQLRPPPATIDPPWPMTWGLSSPLTASTSSARGPCSGMCRPEHSALPPYLVVTRASTIGACCHLWVSSSPTTLAFGAIFYCRRCNLPEPEHFGSPPPEIAKTRDCQVQKPSPDMNPKSERQHPEDPKYSLTTMRQVPLPTTPDIYEPCKTTPHRLDPP